MKDENTRNNSSISLNKSSFENNEESQTLNLEKYKEKIKYVFDYEVNNIKLDNNDDMNCKMSYYSPETKGYRILNYNSFNDKLRPVYKIIPSKDPKKSEYNTNKYDKEFIEIEEPRLPNNVKSANLLKRLVSKQKRRYQDENFDLDMSYITDRVIAMGFPSVGCETVYRNSLTDVIRFFHTKHNDKVKIYNLCLEKDRIYNKNLFSQSSVGLFPATDHNPCPIKLILEFCIDICLYLLKNPNGVAAVHCKAGKGRTGVMICSYLVFSHLCETSEKAFRYYARIRTKDNTGVTIPSQKRYIKYFETFLQANFCPPYIFLIPKIIKSHFSHLMVGKGRLLVKNILQSFRDEKSYFISANKFKLKGVKVGPLPKGKKISLKICNFINNNFDIKDNMLKEIENNNENISVINNISDGYLLTFKILLIVHFITNIFMLMFFGMNQVVLFVVTIILEIRMFIGLHKKIYKYFINCLFLFNMSFACHIIKIIFRYILTCFIYKNQNDITNLRDMNIIETESILWIPGFDIKLDGMWTLIILILFMIYWAILIALFESKRNCFDIFDQKEYDEYLTLINEYYKLPRNVEIPKIQEEQKMEQ